MSKTQQKCLDTLHGFTDKVNFNIPVTRTALGTQLINLLNRDKSQMVKCLNSYNRRLPSFDFALFQVLQERKADYRIRKANELAQKENKNATLTDDNDNLTSKISFTIRFAHFSKLFYPVDKI